MVRKLLVALSLLLSLAASAEDGISLRTGFGTTTEKHSALYSLNYEGQIAGNSFYRLDLGTWTDNEVGHSGALFAGGAWGCRFGGLESFNVTPVLGVLVMGEPDAVLGSPFNFTEELAIGYQQFSMGWKHVSNGGLASPNLGRDYWFFNVVFPMGGL